MTKDEALDLALEALEDATRLMDDEGYSVAFQEEAITAIKQARSASVQEHQINQLEKFKNHVLANADALGVVLDAPAAPVQEPVGEVCGYYERGFDVEKTRYGKLYNQYLPLGIKLYTTPPAAQRQWVGLTDEEVDDAARYCVKSGQSVNAAIRAIEAKLKEKNT